MVATGPCGDSVYGYIAFLVKAIGGAIIIKVILVMLIIMANACIAYVMYQALF